VSDTDYELTPIESEISDDPSKFIQLKMMKNFGELTEEEEEQVKAATRLLVGRTLVSYGLDNTDLAIELAGDDCEVRLEDNEFGEPQILVDYSSALMRCHELIALDPERGIPGVPVPTEFDVESNNIGDQP
jgi:hypothetical protein